MFEAVLYPEYAIVDVPVDATTNREHSYYWDSDLEETGSKSTTDYRRFDLADVDANVVVSIVDGARAKVEDPQSWYSIIRAPSAYDGRHLDLGLREQRVRRVRVPSAATRRAPSPGTRAAPRGSPPRIRHFEPRIRACPNPPESCYRTVTSPSPATSQGAGWMTNQEVGRWLERRPGRHAPATRLSVVDLLLGADDVAAIRWLGSRVGDRRQPQLLTRAPTTCTARWWIGSANPRGTTTC